ncbi:MAG: radical SAM protein [Lentisphaeria bacterium]
MENFKYVFGLVPSRRLGLSLGVSPIPERTCNHTCVYCQLGRTQHLTNTRKMFFPTQEIVQELKTYLEKKMQFDVITLVGEGEPTLYLGMGEIIQEFKKITDKPITVITNGALMSDPQVRKELCCADIVLPSMDATNPEQYRKINRPFGTLQYQETFQGLIDFSHEFKGELWVEIMLIEGMNNDEESLQNFKTMLSQIKYDRVYLNTPVRPPAEGYVQQASKKSLARAVDLLGGISIDMLTAGNFFSEVPDSVEALTSICRRHPMNQFEIAAFLKGRKEKFSAEFAKRLASDSRVTVVTRKGIRTYRAK